MKCNCTIISGELNKNNRRDTDIQISNHLNEVEIVYFSGDTLDEFELQLNKICGSSSKLFILKKRLVTYLLSVISVTVILFALISSSLYEDIFKKIIFETPFTWTQNDTISIFFVIVFFLGLVMMPSILDGESSEFKEVLKSWFNKDARIQKRLKLSFNNLDKKSQINIYNIDILEKNHWMWRLILPLLLKNFLKINIFVRNDLAKPIKRRLQNMSCLNTQIKLIKKSDKTFKNYNFLFSKKEEVLSSLMQLSSTNILDNKDDKIYVSLELFEYCGRNFYDTNNDKTKLISGFQNFINRCFDDFCLLKQYQSNQIFFTKNVKIKDLDDEKRRLSYYLRNHIEECLEYFDNPISLLILYYYVKDIVLDDKRKISILEKFIFSIENKQQYDLINNYWFDIAGFMFDLSNLDSFIKNSDSIYRKLSIKSLNVLISLFERNGKFEQALLLGKYLYEINPNKYSIDICSLYERMGEFDNAYNSLSYNITKKDKPSDVEVRFYQRKAWIIVSQRREKNRNEGILSLEKLEKLLFGHKEFNEPLWLWHFYNIKANYDEWNEEYDLAINNYMKSLCVPALGAFEYGATFVNMAIAYRFKFLSLEKKDIDIINQAIYLGDIGLKLKDSVGDKDEMPVVLHNQALNILYKVAYFDDTSLLDEVLLLTNEALVILDETKSKKRLGMILTEIIIAKNIININFTTELDRLNLHWETMDHYEKNQSMKIYEIFLSNKMTKIANWIN